MSGTGDLGVGRGGGLARLARVKRHMREPDRRPRTRCRLPNPCGHSACGSPPLGVVSAPVSLQARPLKGPAKGRQTWHPRTLASGRHASVVGTALWTALAADKHYRQLLADVSLLLLWQSGHLGQPIGRCLLRTAMNCGASEFAPRRGCRVMAEPAKRRLARRSGRGAPGLAGLRRRPLAFEAGTVLVSRLDAANPDVPALCTWCASWREPRA
jgi:hypothetical protein